MHFSLKDQDMNSLHTCTASLHLGDGRLELAIRDGGVFSMVEKRC